MGNKLDKEISKELDEENTLEYAKYFKKYLRFDIGTTVFLVSDIKRKCPMTVEKFLLFDEDEDYNCLYANSQRQIQSITLKDKILTIP